HLGKIRVEIAHHLARARRLHPRREVAQVGEEHRDLLRLTFERHPPGQDLVADLATHILAERLLQELALPQAADHAIEALGHGADLVIGHDRAARLEIALLDMAHGALELAERASDAPGDVERESDRSEGADRHEEVDYTQN